MSRSHSHISIENALIEYYKLKDKYDDKYDSKKQTIMSDEILSLSKKKDINLDNTSCFCSLNIISFSSGVSLPRYL